MPDGEQLRVFAPRRARFVMIPLAVIVMLGFIVIGIGLRGEGVEGFDLFDQLSLLGLGALFVGIMLWMVSVRARPSGSGLYVRNLVRARRLTWAEIVAVRFEYLSGDPWVTLDLADGTTLAVMAIQRADGEYGLREAERLSSLVDSLGTAGNPR
ncbi:PH domain-containing protein [Saxibacter everestensis]|uniref:PH domain-containing protein n=1 Tax=Saxibacter everestensis TaxID=2909229 RepID=A0ABY8R022_9MICO|nr:PH domain-containing protein [Brevibacteriaceae bacterium ZFBP1038]